MDTTIPKSENVEKEKIIVGKLLGEIEHNPELAETLKLQRKNVCKPKKQEQNLNSEVFYLKSVNYQIIQKSLIENEDSPKEEKKENQARTEKSGFLRTQALIFQSKMQGNKWDSIKDIESYRKDLEKKIEEKKITLIAKNFDIKLAFKDKNKEERQSISGIKSIANFTKDKALRTKIEEKMAVYRETNQDGNSFFRALGLAFLENLFLDDVNPDNLISSDVHLLLEVVKLVPMAEMKSEARKDLDKVFENEKEWIFAVFRMKLAEFFLMKLKLISDGKAAHERNSIITKAIVDEINKNLAFDVALIYFLRCLILQFVSIELEDPKYADLALKEGAQKWHLQDFCKEPGNSIWSFAAEAVNQRLRIIDLNSEAKDPRITEKDYEVDGQKSSKPMRKQPSYSMAACPNRFQIEFIFHKLELVLSNPTSRISLVLRIGSQRFEPPNRFKASKETDLQNTSLSLNTMLYEHKNGLYQEKIAQLDVCLTNSKVTNSIGHIKLDFSSYANQSPTFEKAEYLPLQRSVEYQGKLLFTLKGSLIEKAAGLNQEENKREFSEIGRDKRSFTPTPKTSSRGETNNNRPQPIDVAQRKINNMTRGSSKSPLRKEKEKEEPLAENEQITLEKTLKNLKLESENRQIELKLKTTELSDREKNLQELTAKLKSLERENSELGAENQKTLDEINKNKDFLAQNDNKPAISEKVSEECMKISNEIDHKIQETEKNNEKLLLEKLELQIGLQMLRKKREESTKFVESLRQNLQQKDQEIAVLNRLNSELQTEYAKISASKDERSSPLKQPTREAEDTEKKCQVLEAKNSAREKELDIIKGNIEGRRKKWEDKEREFREWEKKAKEAENESNRLKENLKILEKTKKDASGKMNEVGETLKEIEETLNDAEQKFFKSKHDLAEIHNILMEKGRTDLIEEIELIRNGKTLI